MFDAYLVLDGEIPSPNAWPMPTPPLYCTDGAANHLLKLNIKPDCIIGDLDSLSPDTLKAILQQHAHTQVIQVDDQDTTDFEKALQYLIDNGIKRVLCLGVLGKSADHAFHNLSLMARYGKRINLTALHTFNEDESHPAEMVHQWVSPVYGATEIEVPVGTTLSLIPMAAICLTTQGLKWDVAQVPLSPDGMHSIRNETVAEKVFIHASGPALCFIVSPNAPIYRSR